MINNYEYFLMFLAIFFGVIYSYQDVKERIVSNNKIKYGLIFASLTNVFFFIMIFNQVNYNYWIQLLSNFLISVLVSFTLWNYNIWGAGDAKIFMFFSLSLPLIFYSNSFIPYFPSLVLLINIFLVGFAYGAINLLFNFKLSKEFFKDISKSFTYGEVLKKISIIFLVGAVGIYFEQYFPELNINLFRFGLFFIFNRFKEDDIQQLYLFFLISVIPLIFYGFSAGNILFLKQIGVTALYFFAFSIFIKVVSTFVISQTNSKVLLTDLKKGNFIGENIVKKENISKKDKDFLMSKNVKFKEKGKYNYLFFNFDVSGFKFKKSEYICKVGQKVDSNLLSLLKLEDINNVEVKNNIPFAFIMFLGLILTIVFRGLVF